MSRRMLFLARRNLLALSTGKSYNPLNSPAQIHVSHSNHNPSQHCHLQSQIRFVSTKGRQSGLVATVIGSDYGPTKVIFELLCENCGMTKKQANALIFATHLRMSCYQGVRFVYQCLKNRDTWTQNPSSIPAGLRHTWGYYVDLEEGAAQKGYSAGIHLIGLNDDVLSDALYFLGLDAIVQYEKSDKKNTKILAIACGFLEVSVLFGHLLAASALVNYGNRPSTVAALAAQTTSTSTAEAYKLISEEVTNDPESAPWEAISTYIDTEYSGLRIRRQSPAQLKWAIDVLEYAIPKATDFLESANGSVTKVFKSEKHPCKLILYIVDYCLQNRISLPGLTQGHLTEIREGALIELVGVDDPVACMTIVLDLNKLEPGSDDWVQLIATAALAKADKDPDAAWLMAIYHARKGGFLPAKTQNEGAFANSTALTYAKLSFDPSQPRAMLARTYATAALCRASGDHTTGLKILQESMDYADIHPKFPKEELLKLEATHHDYMNEDPNKPGYWDEKKINGLIDTVFNMENCMRDARVLLKEKTKTPIAFGATAGV